MTKEDKLYILVRSMYQCVEEFYETMDRHTERDKEVKRVADLYLEQASEVIETQVCLGERYLDGDGDIQEVVHINGDTIITTYIYDKTGDIGSMAFDVSDILEMRKL